MTGNTARTPLFVFIPGILHTPAHFNPLETALRSKGFGSICLSLPSIGPGATSVGPRDDPEYVQGMIRQLVVQDGRDVILVCHSFGGVLGCQAVKGFERKVREQRGEAGGILRIVFMNAVIVKEGECALDALARTGQEPPPWIIPDPSNKLVRIPNELAADYLYNDLGASDAKKWADGLLPMSVHFAYQKVVGACWSSEIPKTYVFGEQDKALLPRTQRRMLDQVEDSTWTTRHISSGHSPFLSQPDVLANVLIEEGGIEISHRSSI